MRPSVSRLIAYVTAIGVPLAEVFDPADAKPVAVRHPAGGRRSRRCC